MKKFLLFCLFLSLGIKAFSQESQPVSLDEAIRDSAQYLAGTMASGSRVLVLNVSAPTGELSNYIIEELSAGILNYRTLTVVDRKGLEPFREMGFSMSGELSSETALRIARMLNAQSVISGSVSAMGNYYRLQVQAMAVETAAIQGTQTSNVIIDKTLSAMLAGQSHASAMETPQGTSGGNNAKSSSSGGKFALGVQAGPQFSFGGDIINIGEGNYSSKGNIGFYASLYGAFAFTSVFSLQTGLGLSLNNGYQNTYHNKGYGYYYDSYTEVGKFSVLDIPILAAFTFRPAKNLFIRPSFGLLISIPLTDLEMTAQLPDFEQTTHDTFTFDSFPIFGINFGLGLGYRIGPGNIVFDIRALVNYPLVTWANDWWTIRNCIPLLLGYEFRF